MSKIIKRYFQIRSHTISIVKTTFLYIKSNFIKISTILKCTRSMNSGKGSDGGNSFVIFIWNFCNIVHMALYKCIQPERLIKIKYPTRSTFSKMKYQTRSTYSGYFPVIICTLIIWKTYWLYIKDAFYGHYAVWSLIWTAFSIKFEKYAHFIFLFLSISNHF